MRNSKDKLKIDIETKAPLGKDFSISIIDHLYNSNGGSTFIFSAVSRIRIILRIVLSVRDDLTQSNFG